MPMTPGAQHESFFCWGWHWPVLNHCGRNCSRQSPCWRQALCMTPRPRCPMDPALSYTAGKSGKSPLWKAPTMQSQLPETAPGDRNRYALLRLSLQLMHAGGTSSLTCSNGEHAALAHNFGAAQFWRPASSAPKLAEKGHEPEQLACGLQILRGWSASSAASLASRARQGSLLGNSSVPITRRWLQLGPTAARLLSVGLEGRIRP
jgi:hypothetical protein